MKFIGGRGIKCLPRELVELRWHWGKRREPRGNVVLTKIPGRGTDCPLCFALGDGGGVSGGSGFLIIPLQSSAPKDNRIV